MTRQGNHWSTIKNPNTYQNFYIMKVALLMVMKGGLITGVGKQGSYPEDKFILSVAPKPKMNCKWIRRNYGTFFLKNTT